MVYYRKMKKLVVGSWLSCKIQGGLGIKSFVDGRSLKEQSWFAMSIIERKISGWKEIEGIIVRACPVFLVMI